MQKEQLPASCPNAITHGPTHGPQSWGGLFHHTNKNAGKGSSFSQMLPTLEATDTDAGHPSARTQMARTTQAFQRCLQDTEMKRKI